MQRRKATFKLDPSAAQGVRLEAWTQLHCEMYKAALEERIDAWREVRKSVSSYEQQNALPQIKSDRPEFIALGSHTVQQTLRSFDRAFASFFRRVKARQTSDFPRFKFAKRFSGFAYPDPADWTLMQHGGTLRIRSGEATMSIRARGKHRFGLDAKPNDITITRKNGAWFLSVTLRVPDEACARSGSDCLRRGVDFGINGRTTFDDGQTVENPRWLRVELLKLAALQRQRARRRRGSLRFNRLDQRVARLHERIANLRRDVVHQRTTEMVQPCAVLATEELAPRTMSRSARGTRQEPGRHVRQKAELTREMLSAGFGMAHPMLAYKAEEAGTRLHLSDTRQLKPSQRCAACWEIVPKTIKDRVACPSP